MIFMESNQDREAQLKKHGFRWRIVIFHHSIFSPHSDTSKKSDAKGLDAIRNGEQIQFLPIIGVDGRKITYQSYITTRNIYDKATISKDLKGGEKIIQQTVLEVTY